MNIKKIRKNAEAVSPVIATLMLVIVAVGAAGAFYAWQINWQGDVTVNIEGVEIASGESLITDGELTIGGSTTVYEFSAAAVPLFTEAYPQYKVTYQGGGSGAGIKSCGLGLVDMGAASKYPSDAEIEDYGLQVHTVAYDAVVIVSSHTGIPYEIDEARLQALYHVNGGGNPLTPPSWMSTDGVTWMAANQPAGAAYTFGEIFSVVDPAVINIYDRSDESGTEEVFGQQLLDCGKAVIEDVGITTGHSFSGNQLLIDALEGDSNGIGFTSYGMALTSSLEIFDFDGDDDTDFVECSKTTIKSGTYDGSRPINYLTKGDPTGLAKLFLDFVLLPENNEDISGEAGYQWFYL